MHRKGCKKFFKNITFSCRKRETITRIVVTISCIKNDENGYDAFIRGVNGWKN
jgi:hypothetical protein